VYVATIMELRYGKKHMKHITVQILSILLSGDLNTHAEFK
jgi:hypothetical protein